MPPTLFDTVDEHPAPVKEAIEQLALAEGEERGAVFTRREVVDFILDLAGYSPAEDLSEKRLLEPSFGQGEFVLAAAERLLDSFFRRGGTAEDASQHLRESLRAVEVHRPSYKSGREKLMALLEGEGLSPRDAQKLADSWLVRGDFLLTPLQQAFSHIVGNPPYVRQERVPEALMKTYRRRYECIYDRADLYVPFIERGLRLLAPGGRLTFICADRWMKNRYGRLLRQLVAQAFRLESYIDMTDTEAFEGEVSAYPAIFAISRPVSEERRQQVLTRTARRPRVEPEHLRALASALRGDETPATPTVETARDVATGQDPWLLDHPREVSVLRRLEEIYPKLEETGCKVGIGVATGADRIFIRSYDELPVEESRKLPLLKTDDVHSGRVDWQGRAVLNPFADDGGLIDLNEYPKFAAYLQEHEEKIRGRHVARKSPDRWYRTIDRIHQDLTAQPKLLIPDIKGAACVAYDEGGFYPHHNLYWITSRAWDLRALQAVLRSAVAEFFVATYSVKMRGGYLRYQAQYLRRIRLPHWKDVPSECRKELTGAAEADRRACDEAAFALYGLNPEEREIIRTAVYEAARAE